MRLSGKLLDKIRDFGRENRGFSLLFLLFLGFQIVIVFVKWNKPLIWDSAVYIGMGKFLYSLGTTGYWELFRPPLLPLLIGFFWKLGMPLVNGSRILALAIVSIGSFSFYNALKKIFTKRIALYSTGLMISNFLFFNYSNHLLTGVFASLLVFGSFYFAINGKFLFGGLSGALAFLVRFPSALIAPTIVAGIFFMAVKCGKYRRGFRNTLSYSTGFFVVVVPYFILNQIFLGNFLEPLTTGIAIPALNPSSYLYGFYYLKAAIVNQPLFLFLPLGILVAAKEMNKKHLYLLFAFSTFYTFFTAYPHKEARFLLLFLPLMSVLTALGIENVSIRLQEKLNFRIAFLIMISAALLINFTSVYGLNNWENPTKRDYLRFQADLDGELASNSPEAIPYGDFRFKAVRPESTDEAYQVLDDVDYLAVDTCAWYCTPKIPGCQSELDRYQSHIDQYKKIYEENISSCTYKVYEVN